MVAHQNPPKTYRTGLFHCAAATAPYILMQFAAACFFWYGTDRTFPSLLIVIAGVNVPAFILMTYLYSRNLKRIAVFLDLENENAKVVGRLIHIFIEILNAFLDVKLGFLPLVDDKELLAVKSAESKKQLKELEKILDTIWNERRNFKSDRITRSFVRKSITVFRKWHLLAYKAVEETEREKEHCLELQKLLEQLSQNMYEESVASAKNLFTLKHSIEMISRLSKASNTYQYDLLNNVFKEFTNIWNSSEEIISEAKETAIELVNEDNTESLGYIKHKSSDVVEKFLLIQDTVANLVRVAQNFTSATNKSLKEIQETSRQIAELSEKVKLITVNIRIEAARLTGQKHGFQFLGAEISKHADSTSAFANNSHDKILASIAETDNISSTFASQLTQMEMEFSELETNMAPFNSIVQNTMHRFESIITELQNLSEKIHERVKSSIGNLQIHDIRNQESEHIVTFMEELFRDIEHSTKDNEMSAFYTSVDEKEIARLIVEKFDRIATTENEHKVLQGLKKELDISQDQPDTVDDFLIDGGTLLF
ncbi:MAG: methyl-accepting chemotaxis protein [Spirochaetales bacterium]|nr:methyl-accepting chemotaxis protein [Spirochaetales bacterium]